MSLGSILKSVFGSGGFFDRLFTHIKKDANIVAISVTEGIKAALDSGTVGFLAGIIDSLLKTHIAEDALEILKNYIPKVLAAELALQGLPDNPTEADVLAFEQAVLDAFKIHDDKSKLYTTLAAQLYGKLKDALGDGKITFAEAVIIIEETYQDYLSDKADQDSGETDQS